MEIARDVVEMLAKEEAKVEAKQQVKETAVSTKLKLQKMPAEEIKFIINAIREEE